MKGAKMRTKQRNFAIAFVGFIMAIAMVLGFSSISNTPVNAIASSSETPIIEMVPGAQARKTEGTQEHQSLDGYLHLRLQKAHFLLTG